MPHHRFHCRHHPVLDNSSEFDREELNPWDATFEQELRRDLKSKPLVILARDYPEFTFTRVRARKREKGHAFAEQSGGFWHYADWQTSPNSIRVTPIAKNPSTNTPQSHPLS